MRKILTIINVFISFAGISQSLERSVVANSGGSSTQLEWTIGETIVTTYADENGIVTQGFHQGLLTIIDVTEPENSAFEIKIYPNPFMNSIIIEHNNLASTNMSWTLMDMEGKTIRSETLQNKQQEFNVEDIAAGIYILRLKISENQYKTFELIKQK
jgi:Secretion system C-terminal sorting domain